MFKLFRSLVLIFIAICPIQGIATQPEEAHKPAHTHYLESKMPLAYKLAMGIKAGVIAGFAMGMGFWGISKALSLLPQQSRDKKVSGYWLHDFSPIYDETPHSPIKSNYTPMTLNDALKLSAIFSALFTPITTLSACAADRPSDRDIKAMSWFKIIFGL